MEDAIKEFTKYVEGFKGNGPEIELKYNHTLRVMDLCEQIAKSLNLSEEEVMIAKIIGLLHDIGRFEQWKTYHTWSDKKSVDHADLGVKILKENNYIRKYNQKEEYDTIILKSIEYHNKYQIPDDLTEQEEMFAKIIRDADKIDILNVYIHERIQLTQISSYEERGEEMFSDEVVQTLLQRNLVKMNILKSKLDFLSVGLGFVFDINYSYSLKYLKEKRYCSTLIEQYRKEAKSKKFQEQLKQIQKAVEEYIEEMVTC